MFIYQNMGVDPLRTVLKDFYKNFHVGRRIW